MKPQPSPVVKAAIRRPLQASSEADLLRKVGEMMQKTKPRGMK